MKRLFNEEYRKSLQKKREYYSKHPEEAKREFAKKRKEDFGAIVIEEKKSK